MGNCQAAEAATVLIHHPSENKVERIYWSVTASDVMKSNPGHYVAVVVTSPTLRNEKGSLLKQLKLLRPDDTLLIGHVYRLVSFEVYDEEVCEANERGRRTRAEEEEETEPSHGSGKKHKQKTGQETGRINRQSDPSENVGNDTVAGEDGVDGFIIRRSQSGGRGRGGWRPALHSIPELGPS
ncbi:hypothetical protein YC2023_020864 [Brassica napus]